MLYFSKCTSKHITNIQYFNKKYVLHHRHKEWDFHIFHIIVYEAAWSLFSFTKSYFYLKTSYWNRRFGAYYHSNTLSSLLTNHMRVFTNSKSTFKQETSTCEKCSGVAQTVVVVWELTRVCVNSEVNKYPSMHFNILRTEKVLKFQFWLWICAWFIQIRPTLTFVSTDVRKFCSQSWRLIFVAAE